MWLWKRLSTRGSTPDPESQRPTVTDYVIRARSLYDRNSDLRQLFDSAESAAYARFVDTEAILYLRELQEAGVAMPPWQEMLTVCGETDLRTFLSVGYQCYEIVRRHIPDDLPVPTKILDFGVGCARTMRFFYRETDHFECYGCDVDHKSIAYLQKEVPFIDARVTRNRPPLPYKHNFFDLVYSISVFTHLNLETFKAWIVEMHRILRPGGIFQVTLHGQTAFSLIVQEPERRRLIHIAEEEYLLKRDQFESGFVWLAQPVYSADIDTAQFGICFIQREKFERIIEPYFDLVEYVNGEIGGWQDMAVLRKR